MTNDGAPSEVHEILDLMWVNSGASDEYTRDLLSNLPAPTLRQARTAIQGLLTLTEREARTRGPQ